MLFSKSVDKGHKYSQTRRRHNINIYFIILNVIYSYLFNINKLGQKIKIHGHEGEISNSTPRGILWIAGSH